MSIINQQLVDIQIVASADGIGGVLQLQYQGQIYHLQQAFSLPKSDSLAAILLDRINQKYQKLAAASGSQFLLVQETAYYSCWELTQSRSNQRQSVAGSVSGQLDRATKNDLELQQASIWLFQELWSRLEESIGSRQLKLSANSLLAVTPQIKSWVDLDVLLTLDPLQSAKLGSWTDDDFTIFSRQIYEIVQRKLGRKFGSELTFYVIQNMPEPLQLVLRNIINPVIS